MQADMEVICLGHFYTEAKQNITQGFYHPNFELIHHDITELIRGSIHRRSLSIYPPFKLT